MSSMYRWAAYGAGGTLLAYYGATNPWMQSYLQPLAPTLYSAVNNVRPSTAFSTGMTKTSNVQPTSVLSAVREMVVNTTFAEPQQPVFTSKSKSGVRKRIVAIGDLHGDLAQMKKAFHLMGIIDDKDNWAGGDYTTFVQTGDVVDRGDDTIAMYDLLQKLEKQAAAAGGEMHVLLGNHETMNMVNDWRYVTPGDIASYGGPEARKEAWSKHGSLGKWLRHKDTVLVKGDSVFVHAGLTPKFLDTPENINNQMRSLLLSDKDSREIDKSPILRGGGPVWYRGYALTPVPETCEDLRNVLKFLGVRRMVSGHTPQEKSVLETCDGQYVVIDLGISKAYYSNLGGLEMLAPEKVNGPWEVYAVYPFKRQRLDVPSSKL